MVVSAPERGPGNWAGAPHALLDDGLYWLSYRVRRATGPEGAETRGVETVVARSEDGESFATIARIERDGIRDRLLRAPLPRPATAGRLAVVRLLRHT